MVGIYNMIAGARAWRTRAALNELTPILDTWLLNSSRVSSLRNSWGNPELATKIKRAIIAFNTHPSTVGYINRYIIIIIIIIQAKDLPSNIHVTATTEWENL
jgi:hypothetical protein